MDVTVHGAKRLYSNGLEPGLPVHCILRPCGDGGQLGNSTGGGNSRLQSTTSLSAKTAAVTFGRLAVSDSELGVDVIDFDECYCYLFTVLYCSLVLHAGPF